MREKKHPKLEEVELSDLMYALSDPVRIAIVRTIAKAERPLTCGELDAGRPKSSMSHHFKILRDAGIIETRIESKEHFNSLRVVDLEKRFPGIFNAIIAFILN